MNGYRYAFDNFEIEPANRVLLRNGEIVPLTGKVFDVLLVFAENPSRLLEKDEMIERVWGDSFVEEGNLARNVSTLRKALGDEAKPHKFIDTVQGRGYRFVAAIRGGETETAVLFDEQGETTDTAKTHLRETAMAKELELKIKKRVSQRYGFATVALLAVISVAVAAYLWRAAMFQSSDRPQIKSIAILPLKSINVEGRNPIYDFGVAESLIMKLSLVRDLTVRPLSATRKYADLEQDALAAGKELKVDYILASNYQFADNKIRITSQLINVGNGTVEEVFNEEENNDNIFSVQDAIAANVGQKLLTKLNAEQKRLLAKHYTNSEEAYQFYLKGLYFWNRRTDKNLQKATDYFNKAVTVDPNYALAFSGLANCYALYATYEVEPAAKAFPTAKAMAEKALALDETLAEPHTTLAFVLYHYEWDWVRAESEFKRALEINPNLSNAHHWYGEYLGAVGRFDEAISEQKIALQLDPSSFIINMDLGWNYYLSRHYDEAVMQYRTALEIDPNSPIVHYTLSQTFEKQNKFAGATEEYLMALNADGYTSQEISPLKQAAISSDYGKFIKARLQWRPRVRRERIQFEAILSAADYAFLHQKNEALAYLQKALEAREADCVFLKFDPSYDNLRDEPQFDEILRRIGLP